MKIEVDKIVKIQAEQLLEWKAHPEVFQHLLEQALQKNLENDRHLIAHIRTSGSVWRGQDIDHEAVSFLKEVR
jgi:hypothetical protein